MKKLTKGRGHASLSPQDPSLHSIREVWKIYIRHLARTHGHHKCILEVFILAQLDVIFLARAGG